MFYIDLDHLKLVNDTHGHATGDAVLRILASRLKKLETPQIHSIRLGGDEFAILLKNTTYLQIRTLLSTLPQILSQPFHFKGISLQPTVSAGVAIYPIHATSAFELRHRADTALYHAKKRGRNRASMFSQAMKASEKRQHILQKNAEKALSENKIKIKYQPILDTQTHTLQILQALPVWPQSVTALTRGRALEALIDTRTFSNKISDALLSSTLHKLRSCHHNSENPVPVMLRFPIPTILADGFAQMLLAKLEGYGVKPSCLILEIPSHLLHRNDLQHLLQCLNTLTKNDVKLCVTQYLSCSLRLEDLQQLKISFLKIQSAALQKLNGNQNTQHLIRAATQFAHALNVKLILSDIKNTSILKEFSDLSLDFIQGDAISRPMTMTELYHAVSSHPESIGHTAPPVFSLNQTMTILRPAPRLN